MSTSNLADHPAFSTAKSCSSSRCWDFTKSICDVWSTDIDVFSDSYKLSIAASWVKTSTDALTFPRRITPYNTLQRLRHHTKKNITNVTTTCLNKKSPAASAWVIREPRRFFSNSLAAGSFRYSPCGNQMHWHCSWSFLRISDTDLPLQTLFDNAHLEVSFATQLPASFGEASNFEIDGVSFVVSQIDQVQKLVKQMSSSNFEGINSVSSTSLFLLHLADEPL